MIGATPRQYDFFIDWHSVQYKSMIQYSVHDDHLSIEHNETPTILHTTKNFEIIPTPHVPVENHKYYISYFYLFMFAFFLLWYNKLI